MKRIRVNFILILVVAAMLALLLIQAFQTSALYDQKSGEFKERLQQRWIELPSRTKKRMISDDTCMSWIETSVGNTKTF